MGHSIDISQLKNSGNSTMPEKELNPNNTGKNIDGKELQDFGNGLKEFDPAANGFEHVKIERLPNDKDRALAAFDKQMEQRREEVEKYNELLDQYGGEISEEDLRKELNQEFITDTLQDGRGQKFEDNDDGGSDVKAAVASQNKEAPDDEINHEYVSEEQKELDELERELEEDDNMSDYSNNIQEGTESFVDPNLAKYKETSNNLITKTSYDITHEGNDVKYVKIIYEYEEVIDETEDGVGTGTDGTTEDDDTKNDGIVDGKVGDAIDDVSDAILDLAGIKVMYTNRLNEYDEIEGFTGIIDDNEQNKYKVTYEIDFTKISDDDLNKFDLDRDYDTLKKSLEDQDLTCK